MLSFPRLSRAPIRLARAPVRLLKERLKAVAKSDCKAVQWTTHIDMVHRKGASNPTHLSCTENPSLHISCCTCTNN
jgi:hypothetical protein